MPRYNYDRNKTTMSNRNNFPGPKLPVQQLIAKRREQLGLSIRELHRRVNGELDEHNQVPLSTFWEWLNRSNKNAGCISNQLAAAIAKNIDVPIEEFTEAWDLSRLHFTPGTIPEPQAQKTSLEILIEILENDKRQFMNKKIILNIARRLHQSS